MLQTSAIQRMSGGRTRDRLHDPDGPESDPSSTDAHHRQDRSQSVHVFLKVSQDSPSTGTSMFSLSSSDKFLRSKWLRSTARWRFITWNRSSKSQKMPVFKESETPRHRTQQRALDQTGIERVQPLSDNTHANPLS